MKSKKRIITIVWKIVRIVVPIGLIGIIIMKIDWLETMLLFKKIQWFYFILAVIFYILSQFWVAVRWRYLLNFQNIHTRFSNAIGLVFVGLFVSNFLPTTIGGDAVRIIGISQNVDEKDAAVSSVFADRIFGLLCSVLLIPLSLPYITNKSASQFSGGTAFISSISAAFKKVVNFL